jgi:hypothetical protein
MPELMTGSAPNFNFWVHLIRIHDIIPIFLFDQHFKVTGSSGSVSRAHFVTTLAIDMKLCAYSVTVQSGVLCLVSNYLYVNSMHTNRCKMKTYQPAVDSRSRLSIDREQWRVHRLLGCENAIVCRM